MEQISPFLSVIKIGNTGKRRNANRTGFLYKKSLDVRGHLNSEFFCEIQQFLAKIEFDVGKKYGVITLS